MKEYAIRHPFLTFLLADLAISTAGKLVYVMIKK